MGAPPGDLGQGYRQVSSCLTQMANHHHRGCFRVWEPLQIDYVIAFTTE